MADRSTVLERIRAIAERVGTSEGIEIVDVQLLGGAGGHRVLRLVIDRVAAGADRVAAGADMAPGAEDKPIGVTHADCELISQQVGTILDVEDVIPGGRYTLEVSSPGVERKLNRPRDFERFTGHKIKVVLRQPVEERRQWAGVLAAFAGDVITLEPAPGKTIQFPLEQVEKANLKFEW